jgi:hypothetical protein
MRKFFKAFLALLIITSVESASAMCVETSPCLKNGFYLGLGGSFNTINETFNSTLTSSDGKAGLDNYHASRNRLAPNAQFGYWAPICQEWLWGIKAQWKYLDYYTPNVDASRGQHLSNVSFSSINFFGPNVMRDFSSETRINNAFLSLVYFGFRVGNGYAYLGVGPTLFTAQNSISVNSVHTPDGVGDILISTSQDCNKTLVGGTAEIAYNYYLSRSCFVSVSYNYSHARENQFDNTINAAILNGANLPGPTTLSLGRSVGLDFQEVLFSINKVL